MDAPPVQFLRTSDGFDIAYTVCGSGLPFVFVPNLINHVVLSWQLPGLDEWLPALAERFQLVRYDSRGMGMATRNLPDSHVFDDYQTDLDCLVQSLELERFVLCGQGSGGQLAMRYATRHPARVMGLITIGAFTITGLRAGDLIFRQLPREDWEQFLSTTAQGLAKTSDDVPRIRELIRQCVTQHDWLHPNRGSDDLDALLDALRTKTLIIHARDLQMAPVDSSMQLAARIGAQLAVIDGTGNFGDVTQGMQAIETFVAGLDTSSPATKDQPADLSAREVEVLRLIAAGRSNAQIAEALVISPNTVGRHVSNIFDKIGAANRAEATAYALRRGVA